jgi:hypothetical protein
MNINSLWLLCITVRIIIVFVAIQISKSKSHNVRLIGSIVLCTMGIGFIRKAIFGSNDEVQIAKVFWHDTRLFHGMLYILAGYYLYTSNYIVCGIVLTLDIIFSILYRILTNK